jgi:membrane dipeptidase
MNQRDMPAPGRYDFGLTAEQEARAAKLHRDSIVWDMLSQHAGGNLFAHYPAELLLHFEQVKKAASDKDWLWNETLYWPFEMARSGKSDLLREWYASGGLTCGTISDIRVHDGSDKPMADREQRILDYVKAIPWIRHATRAEHIRQSKVDGKVAMYANCQPYIPAPRSLKAFDVAYEKGLRSFMLTYNHMDHIGQGCTERVDAGLSMFGVEVVEHMNRIGMMIDTSHCSHLTTLDACRHSKKPVNANHTSAKALHRARRAKSNEALRAIADTGGVIGVLALPAFLTSVEVPTIEHMLDHVDYIAGVVGWQHVAIGTDWPMQAPDDVILATLGVELKGIGYNDADRIDVTRRLVGFDDVRDLPTSPAGWSSAATAMSRSRASWAKTRCASSRRSVDDAGEGRPRPAFARPLRASPRSRRQTLAGRQTRRVRRLAHRRRSM